MRATDPFEPFHQAFNEFGLGDDQRRAAYVDLKTWLVDDVLVKVDRASMAHALEVRTPFLDHRIVEFSFRLPASYKMHGLQQKRVLKRSQRNRLPKEILARRKAGFNAPVSRWFKAGLADHFHRTVLNGPGRDVLNAKCARKILRDHEDRVRDNGMPLLTLTVLGLWLEQRRPRMSDYMVREQRTVAGQAT